MRSVLPLREELQGSQSMSVTLMVEHEVIPDLLEANLVCFEILFRDCNRDGDRVAGHGVADLMVVKISADER